MCRCNQNNPAEFCEREGCRSAWYHHAQQRLNPADWRRLYQNEYAPPQRQSRFAPDELMDLAQRNVVVGAYVQHWRRGDMSFEQCLIACVSHLVMQNEQLLRTATVEMEREGMRRFIPASEAKRT